MISVVIPLYNKEKAIIGTLESVKAQTFTEFECIIVNDGSTDNSARVVEEWINNVNSRELTTNCLKYPSFRLINKENGGVCSARNRGIRVSDRESEFVAFLDGDDLWDKDYLTEITKMQEDFPEASMWGINFAEVVEGNKLARYQATGLSQDYRGYVDNYFELAGQGRQSDLFCSSSVVIRKDVFDKVGYFDERLKYAEDTDMWWRIIARYRVAFYDRYMCFYQVDAENRALKRRRALTCYLPYYIAKYKEYADCPVFYRYANHWAAVRLRWEYFGQDKENIAAAKKAVKDLDYSVIPKKYRLFYKLPYIIGRWISDMDYKRQEEK